ncbi:MAG: hypothetical protein HY267_08180 [Deltaproteobacteria bacterium]|nr:hypothetical protein [Deltaproteobacteria bacterium]
MERKNDLELPTGPRREVRIHGQATIAGAPVAYVAMLAAVVAGLSLVPFSIVLGTGGGTFPLSEALFALVGIVLGPSAGAVTVLVGRLIGVGFAPHTAGSGVLSACCAVIGPIAAGTMCRPGKRWIAPWVFCTLCYAVYVGRALTLDVSLRLALVTTAANWLALLLWVSPLRVLAVHWLRGPRLVAGLALITYVATTAVNTVNATVEYFRIGWPAEVWFVLAPLIPLERLGLTAVGTFIGVGVIRGLRQVSLVKAKEAGY